jgi:hypothetical protein
MGIKYNKTNILVGNLKLKLNFFNSLSNSNCLKRYSSNMINIFTNIALVYTCVNIYRKEPGKHM